MLKRKNPRQAATQKPLQKGQRFTGTVRDLNSAGDGVVAHSSGRVFFVAGAWVGESGEFEVLALKGRSGTARLIELHEQHPLRRNAPCPHHGADPGRCGGCPWMYMSYQAQLDAKQKRVHDAVRAWSPHTHLPDIIAAPSELAYRNRAQLKSDGRQIGFVQSGTRAIAAIEDCLVLNARNRDTLKSLREKLPNPTWTPKRGTAWTGLHIDDEQSAESVTPNQRRPFRQGNSAQNTRMRQWLKQQIQQPAPTVELFAGAGNFTQVLVECACDILAVDSFAPAVESLAARKLPGVEALCLNLDRHDAAPQLKPALANARLLVLDPPRAGLKNLASYLTEAPLLATILYVSCDLASFSRDVQSALKHGFTLKEVHALDLFPQTPHVELLARLTR